MSTKDDKTTTTTMTGIIEQVILEDPLLRYRSAQCLAWRRYLIEFEIWRDGRSRPGELVQRYAAYLRAGGMSAGAISRRMSAVRWWTPRLPDLVLVPFGGLSVHLIALDLPQVPDVVIGEYVNELCQDYVQPAAAERLFVEAWTIFEHWRGGQLLTRALVTQYQEVSDRSLRSNTRRWVQLVSENWRALLQRIQGQAVVLRKAARVSPAMPKYQWTGLRSVWVAALDQAVRDVQSGGKKGAEARAWMTDCGVGLAAELGLPVDVAAVCDWVASGCPQSWLPQGPKVPGQETG